MKIPIKLSRSAVLMACWLISIVAFAQQPTYTGVVYEEDGVTPMVGATVAITAKNEKNNKAVNTDIDGQFTLKAPRHGKLIVTYVGYNPYEISVEGIKGPLKIVMVPNTTTLDEVIVTALGITRAEKSLGYAVSKVTNEDLTQTPTNNWITALDGKVAGLSLSSAGTGPGGTSRVTIRGDQSINYGSNSPIFIIDGVPMNDINNATGNNMDNLDSPIDYGDPISDLNPEDIAEVSVLKGPAAAALYGSMAANGAIVITTKDGAKQQKGIGITYNLSAAWERAGWFPKFQYEYGPGTDFGLDPYSHYKVSAAESTQGVALSRNGSRYHFGEKYDPDVLRYQWASYDEATGMYTMLPYVAHKDFYSGIFETGNTITNSVTFECSNGNGTNVRASLTDLRNSYILPNTGYNQQTYSVSVNSKLNKWVDLKARGNFFDKTTDNMPAVSFSKSSVLYQMLAQRTINSIKDYYNEYMSGNYENYWVNNYTHLVSSINGGSYNPYRTLYEATNASDRRRFQGTMALTFHLPVNGLTLMTRGGIDYTSEFRTQRRPKYSEYENGFYREQSLNNGQSNIDFLLSYTNNKLVDKRLGLTTSFGGNQMRKFNRWTKITLAALDLDNVYNIYNVPSGMSADIDAQRTNIARNSLYGMVSLSWDNKYYLDITGRNDWSSTLSPDHWSFFYPSVSGSVLLNEVFKMNHQKVNLLKFRLSWANVGNDTNAYMLDSYYKDTDYNGGYLLSTTIANKYIKPENVESIEAGIQAAFFNNRLTLDFAVYNTTTTNQIIDAIFDATIGATAMTINAGEVRNRGIEIAFGVTPISTRDWTWSINFTWDKNWNKLVALTDDWDATVPLQTHSVTRSAIYNYSYVGGRMYELYGYGFKRAPEGAYYIDENGNQVDCSGMHIVNSSGNPELSDELMYIGNALPDWHAGITTNLRYRNFNLAFTFTGQYGGYCYSTTYQWLSQYGKLTNSLEGRYDGLVHEGVNQIVDADGNITYTKNTTVTADIQDYYKTYVYSSKNAESNSFKTSYLKLKQVRLDYAVPTWWVNKNLKGIKSLSAGAYATNVFCLSHWPQYDPETGTMSGNTIYRGIEMSTAPMTRTFGFNLKVQF